MKFLPVLAMGCCCVSMSVAADLPRSSPESQGVSSSAVLDFVRAADSKIEGMNSLMVVRHGHVVAEGWWAPYRADAPHSLYSLSKSFTSTAVGLAIAEGKLSLDDEVVKFFPEDVPAEPGKNLKAMRVSDLLRMSTGHQDEPRRGADQPWTRSFLSQPVPHKPGSHFLYNTSATYMLSAIVQKATGMTLLDYLRPRLFEPIGIEHPTWETSPQGISAGGYGLSIRTEDIAKFGQLYLNRGKWGDKQLVPESWVDAATARQTSNGSNPKSDWDQGYGYQFWRSRNNAYRGDGAFGQYCIVLPDQDAVIAITSGVKDMQAVLNLVWEKLLPAFQPESLGPDEVSREKLALALRQLSIKPQEGSPSPPKLSRATYTFASNDRKIESIRLEPGTSGDASTIVLRIDGVERKILCGSGSWKDGRIAFGLLAEQPVAASGGWSGSDEFTAKLCLYETPFMLTLRLKLSGAELGFESELNVGFGSTSQPRLTGKAE